MLEVIIRVCKANKLYLSTSTFNLCCLEYSILITPLLYIVKYPLCKKGLTIIQRRNHNVCSWSISPNVADRDGAVVGGSWCEPSQCEGACCCVLHGNGVPSTCTNLRNTGERVANDHFIAQIKRGPRECHVPCCMLSDCETLWWNSGGWGGTRI